MSQLPETRTICRGHPGPDGRIGWGLCLSLGRPRRNNTLHNNPLPTGTGLASLIIITGLHSFTLLLSLSSLSPPWSSLLGVRFVSTKVIVMLRFFSSSSVRPDLWRCVVCVQHAKPTVSYDLTMASQAQATNPSANMHPVRPPPLTGNSLPFLGVGVSDPPPLSPFFPSPFALLSPYPRSAPPLFARSHACVHCVALRA